MKKIDLTRGKSTIVDDADFEWLNQWKWHTSGSEKCKFYAARDIYFGYDRNKKRGIHKTIYLHKQLLNSSNKEVDHINGDSLDNRKGNLRIADHLHNGYNLNLYRNNKTGFKGVYFHGDVYKVKKYSAHIRVDRKLKHLGYFVTAREAAIEYDNASIKFHGKFGRLNAI